VKTGFSVQAVLRDIPIVAADISAWCEKTFLRDQTFRLSIISSLYQMAAPGNYSIMVKRKIYSLDGKGVKQAESNAVHVRVLKKV
jgi:hypothetical protein